MLAALIGSGIAYADGRVLSVVSPSAEEVKEPAKPQQKRPAKKAAKKTAKKTKRKVAAPARPGEAIVQPVTKAAAPKKAKKAPVGKEKDKALNGTQPAAPLMASEPKVEMLPNHQAHPRSAEKKMTEFEKPKTPGQVYVLFQSKPVNAEVVVDGYYAGSTPLELPIKEGNHSIRLIYPGYEEWERKFNAYKGMRVNALLVEKKQVSATP